MKKTSVVMFSTAIAVMCAGVITGMVGLSYGAPMSGEALFKQHCAICHPDGGNIVNPKKTLHAKDLAANNIKTPGDIVKRMRDPGPGMSKFDVKTISDREAKAIAGYVLKTFKH